MIRSFKNLLVLFFLLLSLSGFAQNGVLTVGLQLKPVIPVAFFNDISTVTVDDISAEMTPTFGYSFGMTVRRGIGDLFALETGINYIQRNYDYDYIRSSFDFQEKGDITFIGYEIPLTALVYVQLGEQTYMNVAAGFAAAMFPSDVTTSSEDLRLYVFRKNWIQGSVIANLGFEFRTEESGYFYVGATYNSPLTTMAVAEFTHFDSTRIPTSVRLDLSGTYFSLDLRYYFHNDPSKNKDRKSDR